MSGTTNECRTCGEPIRFAKTKKGSWLPLDAEPNDAGNIVMEHGLAVVLSHGVAARYEGEKFVAHFVTCPDADQHRRKR